MRRGALGAVIVAVLLAVGGGTAWYFLKVRDTPERAASAYMNAWQKSDYTSMRNRALNPPKDFRAVHENTFKDLGVSERSFRLGQVLSRSEGAAAGFTVRLQLSGLGEWSYQGQLELVERDGKWLVDWSPQTIHPELESGHSFGRSRVWPERGKILAADGQPITAFRRVVVVGIEPRRIKDRNLLVEALVTNLGSDPARINSLLSQPGLRPDWFLPVEELTVERYEAVKPAIYPVPGLVFQNKQERLPPRPGFAQQVLGRVGEVTKEVLERLGEPYRQGDVVGLSGLEGAFERRLAGKPTQEILLVDSGDRQVDVVHRVEGEPSQDVQTTLQEKAQNVAEAALEGITQPAAIVVVDVATSQVRVVVNRPVEGFNRAFTGRYPPGSSFKIVTTAALLSNGVSVDQRIECPAETVIGGKTFRNFESKALGDIPFSRAFASSCNTAFVTLASALENEDLRAATRSFGFDEDIDFPLNAAGGSFPEPRDATDRAASAIGQGRVLVSPLHMATLAAAVANGGWRPPQLQGDVEVPAAKPLDPAIAQTIQSLMGSVVSEGTAVKAKVPGKQVAGKTGTAEFGTQKPPQTHAWFVGFSGQYAFSVLVEGGGVGGEVAAPIAARLVKGL
jgi:cell division protein FtsI/penicillin-binding protein 2